MIMLYKRLFISILIRVIFISLSCLILVFSFYKNVDIVTLINLLVLVIVQIVWLVWSLNRLNRDLLQVFSSLKNEDSSIVFLNRKKEKHFEQIYRSFEEVNEVVRRIKLENAKQNQYFQDLVKHINIGLIVFYPDGQVELFNKAAKDLLKLPGLHNINRLNNLHSGFSNILHDLKPSGQKLLKVLIDGKTIHLSLKATIFKMDGKTKKIVSLQNIINELEEKELESWHKLIRVLTHEIMNSTAPISSSIKLITGFLKDEFSGRPKTPDEINTSVIDNTIRGLGIIEERSEGLTRFVNKYRDLTTLPVPVIKEFRISQMIKNCRFLLKEIIDLKSINCSEEINPPELSLKADKDLIEQVIINLINNSVYALKNVKNGLIKIKVYSDEYERINISISDNGCGMSKEELEKIFIPFYSTNKDGSGIGLSLSRQIMRLHGGTIKVNSTPNVGTEFILCF